MRRITIAVALACILSCSGCALSDLMYNLFGGMNSNEADMNAKSPGKRAGSMLGSD